MIRFSAGLVVVAIGVLIGGVATSKLLLVYIAIGLSVAALIALAIGVVLKRDELFGEQRVAAPAAAGTSIQPNETVDPHPARVPAVASAVTGEAGASGAVGSARDRAAQSPFGQPAYGLGASGYDRDVFGSPAREKGHPERSGAETPPSARPSWAVRQDSPWTLEPPAASAPSAPPASPASPAPTAPLPPWQERLPPPPAESPAAPAAASPPPVASAPAAASPPAVTPHRPESASPAPVWPSWFERSARPAGDTTADKAEPKEEKEEEQSATADKSAGTDETSSTTDLSDGTDTSDDDDDWWPRRSWLLDDDAEETGDAAAAEETASPTALSTDTATESAAEDEPEDTDSAPAEKPGSPEATGSSEPQTSQETSSKQVTVIPGVPRYHKANCILIRFMADDDVQKMTVHEAAEAGCTPCRACQPDEA